MEPDIKKRLQHRLSILEGQIRGLKKMVDDEEYCMDIITQSLAAQKVRRGRRVQDVRPQTASDRSASSFIVTPSPGACGRLAKPSLMT